MFALLVLHLGVAAMVLVPVGLNLLKRRVAVHWHGVIDLVALVPLIAAFEVSFVLGFFVLPDRLGESHETLVLTGFCILAAQPLALYASWRAVRA